MQLITDETTNHIVKPEIVKDLLESLTDAIKQVVPIQVEVHLHQPLENAVVQNEIGVLVGFTGNLYGRIVIQASDTTFGKLGESMFGVSLEQEMLYSFIGELANMIVGNAATKMCNIRREMDITPPTVIIGRDHLYGLDNGVLLPVVIDKVGDMQIILSLQKKGGA